MYELNQFLYSSRIMFSLLKILLHDAKYFVVSFGHSCPLSQWFQGPVGDDYEIFFPICSTE